MTNNLFVYGTLTAESLLRALTGQQFRSSSAVLVDYVRLTLRMPDLPPVPAIVDRRGAKVHGLVLHDMDSESMELLDAFETSPAGLFERSLVTVTLRNGERLHTDAYVVGPAARGHLAEPWDREAFLAEYLEFYRDQVIPGFLERLKG